MNQTVLVTGAAGNLGRAVARGFAERGANLVRIVRHADGGPFHGACEDDRTLTRSADLLDTGDVARAIAEAVERFGQIDVLCNVAGAFQMGDEVHRTPLATWDLLFDRNVRILVHTAQAIVPHMLARGSGKIVNVGALASQRGVARMGAYIASKDAVTRLTETMAAELGEHGVNVNCVLPSIIDSPENRAAMPAADPTSWVAPDDVARVILFLASAQARAIHGAAIPVTGLS